MLLTCDDDLERHIQNLIKIEPRFATARGLTGAIPLRTRDGGYSSIIRTIIGQQVSVAAANAIWERLADADMLDLDKISQASFEELRTLGLSKQKASYLQALAESGIQFDRLAEWPDDHVMETLTAVKGIGKWTAEIYLMFALGRADIFAHGDLALQESARLLFELDDRPTEGQMRKLAQNWSPYRNAAAQLLWAYYHYVKDRAGI